MEQNMSINIIKDVYIHQYIKSFVKPHLRIILFIMGFMLSSVNAQTTDLVLTNKIISTTESFSATNSITAGPNFTITDSGNVTLISPAVAIKPDFFIVKGGELQVISDSIAVDVKTENFASPDEFRLYQNYPNPFNPSTTIKYALPFESSVDITIYNMIGQKIEAFNEGIKEAGYHNVTWFPKNLSSGVYFYSINAKNIDGKNDYSKTLKMLYMK